MPIIARLPLPEDATLAEPVSLELLRAWVRVDGGQEDAVLDHLRKAAREKVEAYTGRFFAGNQLLRITFELGEPYLLPAGAVAGSVSGYYTDLTQLLGHTSYLEEYRKGISIERQLDWPYPALSQTYTVVATIPDEWACPELAKSAILELAGEWYRNRESTTVGTIAPELPVAWRVKLAELRVHVL